MNEIEHLENTLPIYWSSLIYPGDSLEGFSCIDSIEGGDRRWSRTVQVVVKNEESGRYYMWSYEKGLTEYQDNEYRGNIMEVEPQEEIIKRTIWVKK